MEARYRYKMGSGSPDDPARLRLRHLHAHLHRIVPPRALRLCSKHTVALPDPAGIAERSQSPPPAAVLSDEDLATFVKAGFVRLSLDDVPAYVHTRLHSGAETLWQRSGRAFGAGLGNNIAPALPGLVESIVNSASVRGAMQRILGQGYSLYAHRFLHESGTYESGPQSWHHDAVPQGVRPRLAMLLYYPAGASRAMGPTEVLPSSHVLSIDDNPDRVSQVHNFVRLGVNDIGCDEATAGIGRISPHLQPHQLDSDARRPFAVVMHSDLIHRGLPRQVEVDENNPWRPLLKLQFVRTAAPVVRSEVPRVNWETAAGGLGVTRAVDGMKEVWQSTWEWLHGQDLKDDLQTSAWCEDDLQLVVAQLRQAPTIGGEAERLAAAYRLGRAAREGSTRATAVLMQSMGDSREEAQRRVARSGTVAAGRAAIEHVASLCQHESNFIARNAVEALAEFAPTETDRQPFKLQLDVIGHVVSCHLSQMKKAHGGLQKAVGGAGTSWDVLAGCAKGLWLLTQQYARFDASKRDRLADSLLPTVKLLSKCMQCYGTDEHVRADGAEPDEPPPPAHRVQTSARAVRRNASFAILSLTTHSYDYMVAAERLELLDLLHTAMLDRKDRYVQALAVESVSRLAQQAATAGKVSGALVCARAEVLKVLTSARWCTLTDSASPF